MTKPKQNPQKTTLLCFGNPLLDEDNLALEIGKELKKTLNRQKFEVRFARQVDEITEYNFNDLLIIDVAEGMKENQIKQIENIDALQASSIYSLHDFDVGFFLKLMKELGRIQHIRILAIPQQGSPKNLAEKIKKHLNHRFKQHPS